MKLRLSAQIVAVMGMFLGLASAPSAAMALQTGVELQVVAPCYELEKQSEGLALFDQHTNRMQGWSHIQPDITLYKSLKQQADYYQITPDNVQPEAECPGQRDYHAVLVKRYRDWSQQHANGIEPLVTADNVRFEEYPFIDIVVRFNAADSHFLSPKQLITQFGPWLSDSQIQQWDQGQINLELTLFSLAEDGVAYAAGSILNVPVNYFDQWLHLRIDSRQLSLYREQHYQRTAITWAELKDKQLTGFRINPETANGKTLRHYQLDAFDPDQAEIFKETGLSIRALYLMPADK